MQVSDSSHSFVAVTSEGGLLPSDFLQELLKPKSEVEGLDPKSYDLSEGERISEQVNRSWNRLKGCWDNFKRSIADKGLDTATTTETRERWLLPLVQELGFGRLKAAKAIEIDRKSYGISHGFQIGGGDGKSSGVYVPIHLVGSHVDLDHRTPGAVGAAKASPHSLTQQVLNARDDMLWGLVSNGYILRLLRDNVALTRLARVDFDLQQIFDGDLYGEFYLLWLITHRSRFEAERPEQCILEKWKHTAEDKGLRALDNLRPGVEKAIVALGAGLLGHKKNEALREKLRTGTLTPQGLYQQVLRVIYRFLFLLVAEDRDLLHPGEDSDANRKSRKRYRAFYSITRLRGMTLYRAGTPHPDLWQILQLVSRKLGSDKGCPELALPALGSFLWTVDVSTPDLKDCLVSNRQLLEAVHALVFVQDGDIRRTVDYKNLGAEELGSVYESLLELHPQINPDAGTFELKTAAGHERKTTGSYYTPDSLVQCLLDSALEPVVAAAIKGKEGVAAEKAILALKVCDPACGSGHFMIAAAHRLARKLASIRSGGDEPSPEVYHAALRDVISHCIFAVDINPMAVELCRISLWLESMVPGKPLSFLDHHIRVGNSLLGTTPELVAAGLPDAAFDGIEGDDKKACTILRKRNKGEREGIGGLFVKEDQFNASALQQAASALDELPDDRIEDVARKEQAFQQNEHAYDLLARRHLFDTWCAAFVIPKVFKEAGTEPSGITQRHLTDLSQGRGLPDDLSTQVDGLTQTYAFFHWHLAFPEVLGNGGFDVNLGNPPWERTALEELEFFAQRSEEVMQAPTTAARKAIIKRLSVERPEMFAEYQAAKRASDAEGGFFKGSGLFPLGARGRLNTYALFANLGLGLLASEGRLGMVLQTGIAIDAPMEDFWRFLVRDNRVVSLFDFENKELLFPDVHPEQKFALVTLTGRPRTTKAGIPVGFWLHKISDLSDADRVYLLDISELETFSPNTTQPLLTRRKNDLQLARKIFASSEICWSEVNRRGPAKAWVAMTSAAYSGHCRRETDLDGAVVAKDFFMRCGDTTYVPLMEAKQIEQFQFAYATYEGVSEKNIAAGNPREITPTDGIVLDIPKPRFWAEEAVVRGFLKEKQVDGWVVGYRDVTNVNNERSAIAVVIPPVGMLQPLNGVSCSNACAAAFVLGAINSFVCDFVARLRFTGRHLNVTTFSQLPIPRQVDWGFVVPRVTELSYCGSALEGFAKECGYNGKAFPWNAARRWTLRCELDAAYGHFYGLSVEDMAYIFDSFRVLRAREEREYGTFRTRDNVLKLMSQLKPDLRCEER